MSRPVTALLVTVLAAVLLFSFHPTPAKLHLTPTAKAPRPRHAAHAPRRPRTPAPSSAEAQRTVAGAPVEDPYGVVQVAVVVRGHRILDVRPVQVPLDNSQSQAINSQAVPLLRSEVLHAQSARIDVISGASYTSEAYARSLQAALDRAGA